jgi:glutathione peroxidase
MTTVFDFSARRLGGAECALSEFRGQVLLIVNTASQCGFTPQYQGLEALHRKYAGRGLAVLGFPCNQFGRQEPGSAGDIAAFCSENYDVSFPLFEKIDVNGPAAHPLYVFLKARKPGFLGLRSIKWNFTKFLVGRDGAVRTRYAPFTTPERLDAVIARAL